MNDETRTKEDLINELNMLRSRIVGLESSDSDLRLRGLIDRSSEGIALTDEAGLVIEWNGRLAEITGIASPDALGRPIWELQFSLAAPENRTERMRLAGEQMIRSMLESGDAGPEGQGYRQTVYLADGSQRVHTGSVFTVKTDKGYMLSSVIRDITEQSLAEDALAENSRHQETLSRIGRIAVTATTRQDLHDQVVGLVAASLNVDLCGVLEQVPSGDELLLVAGHGWSKGCVGTAKVPATELAPADHTSGLHDPVVTADLEVDSDATSALLMDHGVVSGVSAVICDPADSCGFFQVHTKSRREFTGEEVTFVQSVANIIGEAVLRMRADTRVRDSEEKFRTMYESSSVGIARVSPDYRIEEINSAYCGMLGYTRDELVGRSIWDITHPESIDEARAQQERLATGELDSYQMERRYFRKDGSDFWGLLDANGVRDCNGKLRYYLGNVVDVTERKRAEAQVRRLSVGVEQSPVCIAITDIEGTIEYVNQKFCALSGYTRDEVIGQNPRVLKSGEQPPEVYRELWKTITAGGTWSGQFHNKKKNGELYWEEATIGPITNEHGEITHFIAFKEDITEKRDLEVQLLQSQRLEAIGQLAGGIAHDFNNILTVINGYSSLVLDKLSEGDPKRLDVEQIAAAGERAGVLTHQLLAFSRKQIIRPTVLNLNTVVIDMTTMLRRLVGENIVVRTVLADDLGLTRADSGQMNQIIMNLAVNSRDALPDGGEITIETMNARIDRESGSPHIDIRPGEYCLLSLSDNGIGMDEGTRSHAFEPFFTTKGLSEGTGLGLSTVYGIVMQHNGYVWLYSEPGHGTVVKVYLPLVKVDADPLASPPTAADAPSGSETILLVEDDDTVRGLTSGILERAGYNVLEARDGRRAMDLYGAASGHVDLLLTDVIMPGMSGKELADKLVAQDTELLVVYVSGYTDEAISRSGVLRDDVELLSKPFHPSALLALVRTVLDRVR